MISKDCIDQTIDEHFSIEPEIERIAVYSAPGDNVLRLIEISKDALPTGRVEPFYVTPLQEMPFAIFIADVTPEEWAQIERGQIKLPDGWPKKPFQVVPREP